MIESTVTRGGKTTTTRHYHVASRQLTPEAYLAAARSHWSIESAPQAHTRRRFVMN